jgi:hypothetical protein
VGDGRFDAHLSLDGVRVLEVHDESSAQLLIADETGRTEPGQGGERKKDIAWHRDLLHRLPRALKSGIALTIIYP